MMSYQFLIAWISHSKGLVKTMQKLNRYNAKNRAVMIQSLNTSFQS